jgi:hypothetical protein
MAKSQGNVRMLPSVEKQHTHLQVRYFDMPAGHTVYKTKNNVEKLAEMAAKLIGEKPAGEAVNILLRKGSKAPATTLFPLIQSKVRASGDDRVLNKITWGLHTNTNEFREAKHTIVIGLHQLPRYEITAMVYGTQSKPMHASVSPMDMELARLRQMGGDLIQGVGRSAVREMVDGDVPKGCTLDIVNTTRGPLGYDPRELWELFPGAAVEIIKPKATKGTTSIRDASWVEAANALLGEQAARLVSGADWAANAGYSPRTLWRRLRDGSLDLSLGAVGIAVERLDGMGLRLLRQPVPSSY